MATRIMSEVQADNQAGEKIPMLGNDVTHDVNHDVTHDASVFTLDVRGSLFVIPRSLVTSHPASTLYKLSQETPDETGAVYVNRNPALVRHLVEYYRSGELHLPGGACRPGITQELEFWGVPLEAVGVCCTDKVTAGTTVTDGGQMTSWRHKAWNIYWTTNTAAGKVTLLVSLVTHFLFLLTLLCEPEMQRYRHYAGESVKSRGWVLFADRALLGVLLLWHVTWVLICPSRRHYYVQQRHLVYVIIVLLQVPAEGVRAMSTNWGAARLTLLAPVALVRVSRALLLLPLLGYYGRARALGRALMTSWREVDIVIFLLSLHSVVFGFLAQRTEESEPDASFFGPWWGVVTITTVGYGDVTPITVAGRVWGAVCALIGVLLGALTVAPLMRRYGREVEVLAEEARQPRKVTHTSGPDHTSGSGHTELMRVSVGGATFRVPRQPASPLFPLFTDPAGLAVRDPVVLQSVLDYYYCSGQLHLPTGCGNHIRQEVEFWGIPLGDVAHCCIGRAPIRGEGHVAGSCQGPRRRIWELFSFCLRTPVSVVVHVVSWLVTSAFFVSMLLPQIPQFKYYRVYETTNNSITDIDSDFEVRGFDWRNTYELCLLCVMTLHSVVYMVVCPNLRYYYIGRAYIIYPIVILFQWVLFIWEVGFADAGLDITVLGVVVTAVAKAARALLFLPLLRPWPQARVLLGALRAAWLELIVVCVAFSLAAAVFGYMVVLAEMNTEETHFRDVGEGLWWAVVTLTTVGYGDSRPLTRSGKMVGGACCITGVILMALPVPVLWAGYKVALRKDNLERAAKVKQVTLTRDAMRNIECAATQGSTKEGAASTPTHL